MSFSRAFCLSLLLSAAMPQVAAQGMAWESVDPTPQSNGARATLFGFPFPQPNEQPGFSPSAVVTREDGAYLILPVNGGGESSAELGFVVNPSWQRLRGFQILRLDTAGQVLWKRVWNLGVAQSDLGPALPVALGQTRLTPNGGLAVLAGTQALYLDANGAARQVDALQPPAACSPNEQSVAVDHLFLNADGDLILASRNALLGRPAYACALDDAGQLLDVIAAPEGRFLDVRDFRRGLGFLINTFDAAAPASAPDTRLRQGGNERWRSGLSLEGERGLGLSPAGDAWLTDGAGGLRVVRADGNLRAEIPQTVRFYVRGWLTDGDAFLSTLGADEVRRMSADGVERWRLSSPAFAARLGEWQVLGPRARVLVAQIAGRGAVLTFDLTEGTVQVGAGFPLGVLAAGPLGLDRHVSAASGAPQSVWQRDPSTCLDIPCAPRGVSFASSLDVQVFDSAAGAALGDLNPTGFAFPTYARLRERAPAVVREVNTLELAHARYVSNGEKELLELTRLSERGDVLWRRQLQFPRFDVADAQVEVVNGIVHVAASARGPLANQHRLWALDAQGQMLWERELDEPFKQLARVSTGTGGAQLCGLGFAQRDGRPWQAPLWRCYDGAGSVQVDTRLQQVQVSSDVEISHVLGSRVFLRRLDPLDQSAAGVSLLAIAANGQTVPGAVTWSLAPLGTAEFVRIDAITRRAITLISAPVFASASASRPSALLVAAFDTSGTRLWQQRIKQPLRAAGPGQVYTAVDTDGQGVVHVAFPPNVGPDVFPLRVCRLAAADGALLGCSDAPLDGRVGALFPLSEPSGVWMWANQTLASGASELTLFPLTSTGIAAPVYRRSGLQLRQAGSQTGRFDRSWVVAEPAVWGGVFGDPPPPSTHVLQFQSGRLFRDGFEAVPAR